MTRSALARQNCVDNFVNVTYTAHKKKNKSIENTNDTDNIELTRSKLDDHDDSSYPVDPKKAQDREMKRLRWEVMKFGSSGFKGTEKEKARVALAIELGAKPPKNRNHNYKKLQIERNWEKIKAARITEAESGYTKSLKKQKTRKEKKKEQGILDPYGRVEKGKTR